MRVREIITLQVGHASNYVGAHFWNSQDSYIDYSDDGNHGDKAVASTPTSAEVNPHVLYRSGTGSAQSGAIETFTPRLVSVDLKGSLGGLDKLTRALYGQDHAGVDRLWSGKSLKIDKSMHPQNAFLMALDNHQSSVASDTVISYSDDLSSSVTTWTDFNKQYYHPRSICELNSYSHMDDTKMFSTFTQGREVMADPEVWEDLVENRLRFFIEECDNLQGFNVIADTSTGFSGIASELLSYIRDEMPKTSIVTFGINEALHKSGKQAETVIHSVNSAISCHSISEMSNLYIPIWAPHTNTKMSSSLSFPYMSPHQRKLLAKPYEWSAIVSSAIETITFPTRSTAARSCLDLGNIVNIVNSTGSVPVAGLSTSFPFPLLKSMSKDGKFEEGPVVSSLWTGVFDKPQKGVSTINWLENLSSSSRSGSGSSRNGNGDDGIKSSSQDKVQEEFGNLCVLRGLSNQKRLGGGGFLSVPSIDEALSKFLSNAFPTTISNGKSVIIDTPYPVTEAFPQLFNPSLIDTDGLLLSKSANPADGNPLIKRPTPVTSIPLMARLKTSAELSQVVLAASKAVGGILNSVRAGGGANWSSVLNGTDHDHHHSSSNASPSSVMRMFEEGNKGLNREEFSTIREELEELAARYRDN